MGGAMLLGTPSNRRVHHKTRAALRQIQVRHDSSGLLGLRHHPAWRLATQTGTAICCAGLHTRDSSEVEHNSKRQRANAQLASL